MKNLRTYAIVDFLKQKKYCSIQELVDHFGVSNATMYRDIAVLAAKDAVQKVHGGIALRERPSSGGKYLSGSPFQERLEWNRDKKEILAMQALKRVEENDILFLDSSTTVYYLAELLEKSSFSNLTSITNSVTIIQNFHKFPSHYVRIGLGGNYDAQLNSFLGQATLRELEYLEISKAFLSAFGIGNDKVTTNHEYHASLLMKVMDLAGRKYLLADRSKFDRCGLFRIAPCRAFDEILRP
ncbi:MAG: DeoR/GlpR transcriptional regulator [Lentisphaeria bacterium]|nr:DeoR/GlpR transcriptional regulator [Lentisphaeria bacterium]